MRAALTERVEGGVRGGAGLVVLSVTVMEEGSHSTVTRGDRGSREGEEPTQENFGGGGTQMGFKASTQEPYI